MKRTLPLLQCALPFFLFCMLIAQLSFAQDCKTLAANKGATFVLAPDNYIDLTYYALKPAKWDVSKMKAQLGKVESWIRGKLEGFTGAKLNYYNTYNVLDFVPAKDLADNANGYPFYNNTGIKKYYSGRVMFFAYYCYDNSNVIHTEGESGSTVLVTINNVFSYGPTSDAGVYSIGGKPAFRVLQKKRSEGRIDFYEQRSQDNATAKMFTANDYIILRNSDKPVFIPFTRREYLQQMLKNVDAYKMGEIAAAKLDYNPANEAANKARFDEELKRIDNSKSYTKEQMAPYRKRFIETWETEKQKFDRRMIKVETESSEATKVLQEYLNKPTEWLSRGFNDFYSASGYTALSVQQYLENLDRSFVSEGEEPSTPTGVVFLNPDYFNKKLSGDVPQAITVWLRNGTYPHMLKVAALIKQPGALAPLEALLNPGNTQPEIVPPAVVSTYALRYLPKLKKLTPLVVPVGMKSSVPLVPEYTNRPAASPINFTIPPLSSKLVGLPQALTTETYKVYVQQLHQTIASALSPAEKKKGDDYLKSKNITASKQVSNAAFAAWLKNAPKASLYLYSKAVMENPSDALAANNFAAFLMMGGLPEKSIPVLEYWSRQKPHEAIILANLGNAYYRLGDVAKAMQYALQCVQYDILHPTANKLLCLMYLKKGDTKKAQDHATKSLTTCHDEEVVSILRQLNNKAKPGEIMSRFPAKEFPLLKRIKLPSLPSSLDDMPQFAIDLEAEKASLQITIDDIETRKPQVADDIQQKILMASLTKGSSPLRVKAQYIITEGMQTYQRDKLREYDVFKYNLQMVTTPYAANLKVINKKYNDKMRPLQGGEAGEEEKIAALELAKCKEINAETAKYLGALAPVLNSHAQRQEMVARKFYRDYANWAPYWMPSTTISFPSIEKDYLKDVLNILSQYPAISKLNCYPPEPPQISSGKLKEWEDAYCASFKGKIGVGVIAVTWNCNSWGVEGGEGIVGDVEVNYNDDGSFESFTVSGGLGESWNVAGVGAVEVEAGASVKEFIKIGKDKGTGKWEVQDFGFKTEAAVEASIFNVAAEVKLVEASVAVNAGLNVGGLVPSVLQIGKN